VAQIFKLITVAILSRMTLALTNFGDPSQA